VLAQLDEAFAFGNHLLNKFNVGGAASLVVPRTYLEAVITRS